MLKFVLFFFMLTSFTCFANEFDNYLRSSEQMKSFLELRMKQAQSQIDKYDGLPKDDLYIMHWYSLNAYKDIYFVLTTPIEYID